MKLNRGMSDEVANVDFRSPAFAERMKPQRGAIRSYVLTLRPNAGKAEAARYSIWWAQRMCLDVINDLYGEAPSTYRSTAGRGALANQAQKRARGYIANGPGVGDVDWQLIQLPQNRPSSSRCGHFRSSRYQLSVVGQGLMRAQGI